MRATVAAVRARSAGHISRVRLRSRSGVDKHASVHPPRAHTISDWEETLSIHSPTLSTNLNSCSLMLGRICVVLFVCNLLMEDPRKKSPRISRAVHPLLNIQPRTEN